MTDIAVRAAKADDEAAVLQLAITEMQVQAERDPRFALRPDASARYALYLRERIRDIDSAVFVADRGGQVVGCVIASIRTQDSVFVERRFGYVSDLVVEAGCRRTGCGAALWERAQLWFRGLGVDTVRLHVAPNSPDARAFWQRLGAEDYLCEAWIRLPEPATGGPGAGSAEKGSAEKGSGEAESAGAGAAAGGKGEEVAG